MDFTSLPLDCAMLIIQHLDSHGIISFLNAFPYYKRHTVLVTDHTHLPMFFGIAGVTRKYLKLGEDSPVTSEHELYCSSSAYPIKLVEIASPPESLGVLAKTYDTQDHLLPSQPIHFTNTTFVFICEGFKVLRGETEALGRRLEEFTSCNWHVGLPVLFPEEGVTAQQDVGTEHESVTSFSPGLMLHNAVPNTFDATKLLSVRIENVPVIEGLHAPLLSDLAFIYTAKAIKRPVIGGIVAPLLRRLVVHYSNELPHFKSMGELATTARPVEPDQNFPQILDGLRAIYDEWMVPGQKYLEIAQIGSLNMRPYCDRNDSIPELCKSDYDTDLDLSFINRFQSINFYGVPSFLIKCSVMSGVYRLRWVFTRPLDASIVEHWCDFKKLLSLSMTALAQDVTFPFFDADFLFNLWINVFAARPNIERSLFSRRETDGVSRIFLRRICIYHSPKLARRYPDQIFKLSHIRWHLVTLMFATLFIVDELTFVGFLMPFLKIDNDENVIAGKLPWWIPQCNNLTLRPVIAYEDESVNDADILINTGVFHTQRTVEWSDKRSPTHYHFPTSVKMTLSPIFVSQTSGRVGAPTGRTPEAYIDNFYAIGWFNGVRRLELNVSGEVGTVCVNTEGVYLHSVSEVRDVDCNNRKLYSHKWVVSAPGTVHEPDRYRQVPAPEQVPDITTEYTSYDICK